MKTILFGLLAFAAPSFAGDFAGLPSATTRYVFVDGTNGPSGKVRLDTRNNYYLFGTTTPPPGFASRVVSSGTLVVQSTSATAAYKPFIVLNLAGSEVFSLQQNGVVNISSTVNISGDISVTTITGVLFQGGSFDGVGSGLTALTPANVSAGTLPADVIASSVGVNTVSAPQIVNSGIIDEDVAVSTISTRRLNQTGASTNDVLTWNGSFWLPATPGAFNSFVSSRTNIPTAAPPNQAIANVCVATITFTASGTNDVFVSMNASITDASIQDAKTFFLEDGQLVSPATTATPWSSFVTILSGDAEVSLNFSVAIRAPTAGTRNYCFGFASSVNQLDAFVVNPSAVVSQAQ